jgi:hypothetical protein
MAERTPWDIASVFRAAAAFPLRVSESPQRTWAILTKYKSNRSFVEWSDCKLYRILEYDQVSSYTAELFDSYMDYKVLLKYVQQIIDNPGGYQPAQDTDALDTSIDTMLGARFIMRKEQAKIIEAIGVLSRDPDIITRQGEWGNARYTSAISKILKKATGSGAGKFSQQPSVQTPRSSSEEATSSTRSGTPAPSLDFNFSSLIPAEIWRNWMPVLKSSPIVTLINAGRFSGGAVLGRPPPSDDLDWGKAKALRKTFTNSELVPGRLDNCLPYQYNGSTVMFIQLYNQMALEARKGEKSHSDFDVSRQLLTWSR